MEDIGPLALIVGIWCACCLVILIIAVPIQFRRWQAGRIIKSVCRGCGGALEFSPVGIGETVSCPHCQCQIVLTAPAPSLPVPGRRFSAILSQVKWQWVTLACVLMVCVTAVFIYEDLKLERAKGEKVSQNLNQTYYISGQRPKRDIFDEVSDPSGGTRAKANPFDQFDSPKQSQQSSGYVVLQPATKPLRIGPAPVTREQQTLDEIKDELERANRIAEWDAMERRLKGTTVTPLAQPPSDWVLKYNTGSHEWQYAPPNAILKYNYMENRWEFVPQ